jgi:hypothetical protein
MAREALLRAAQNEFWVAARKGAAGPDFAFDAGASPEQPAGLTNADTDTLFAQARENFETVEPSDHTMRAHER